MKDSLKVQTRLIFILTITLHSIISPISTLDSNRVLNEMRLHQKYHGIHLQQQHQQQQPCLFEYNSTLIAHGEVYSPNYPRHYPNNLDCRYEFHARENERVILQIEDFHLEPPQTTMQQEINFMDFIETVTRSHSEKSLQSLDEKKQQQQNQEQQQLSEEVENKVNSNKQCFYDFLDVFTSDNHGRMYWRSRHCGTHIDSQIVSTSPILTLVFKTDRMLNFRGFKFKFHFSYLNILPLVTEPICGPSEIVGKGGLLASPNYPLTYPVNTECAWTITVDKHERILIKFIDINFSQQCLVSHVSIWDGYVADVNKPDLNVCEKLKYYHKGLQQFNSKTNRIVIKFVGNKISQEAKRQRYAARFNASIKPFALMSAVDDVNNTQYYSSSSSSDESSKNGFQLSWTAVSTESECPEFQCAGGEYCIDTKNFLCQHTYRYCISNKLVCDGVFNCDIGDESDEKYCEFSFIRSKVYLFLCILAALAVALLGVACMIAHGLNAKMKRKQMQQNEPFHNFVDKRNRSSMRSNGDDNAYRLLLRFYLFDTLKGSLLAFFFYVSFSTRYVFG
jgi:hypothetical protein